ncbi:MAG: response regulator [Nitrosopumilales archaeon]|jgi:DNA-binding response OmpR family regulator|nr:response regulator [Nitrosopumilales archaeon]MRN62170.1 response regulator [Nitrosopumilales archaeon]
MAGTGRQERQIRKVMILEDEQDILHLYKDYLSAKGHSVIVTSTTANEAMDDYEKYRPDFVIIDYKLPGKKNGLEAAKEILMSYPSGRILMLTAFHGVKDELKKDFFFDDKMIQILIKPVKLARLADIIIRN